MEILYISNTVSQKYFKKLYDKSRIKPGQQVQKFNEMLLRGLVENDSVYALSVAPATYSSTKQLMFKNFSETENDISYDYLGFVSLPIIKQFFVKLNAKRKIRQWVKKTKGKDRAIICYALSPTLSSAALKAAKKHGVKCTALVTDIPELMNVAKKQGGIKSKLYSIYSQSTYEKMTQYDSYILLTEAMSEGVNPHQKPYIVVEGMTDSLMQDASNELSLKNSPKVVLYAGALFEKYGVMNLVEGFIKANIENCELWLFGNGEIEGYLNQLKNDKVKYFGVVPNSEVVEHEIKAALLVNPRSSAEEFTKYSFPSKNMEYMMSGTPVLACKLPGMPNEYLEYIYIAQDESTQGFADALTKILSKDEQELHAMGLKAKAFVSLEKSNIIQAGKISKFIKGNL